ncbi:beta-galactosidase/beta-glucuronidase [Opitutaceae bacterium TAV1]|nr:beta-galactosidase/beta-glucuronidase [Opitutaceae bacterium TAV1]
MSAIVPVFPRIFLVTVVLLAYAGIRPASLATSDTGNILAPGKWQFKIGVREGKIESAQISSSGQLADTPTTAVSVPELQIRKSGSGPHDHAWWMQEADATEGEIYNFAFQAKGSGAEGRFGVSAGVEFLSGDGKSLAFKRLVGITGGTLPAVKSWKDFNGRFTVPHNAEKFRVRFSLDAWVPAEASFRNVIASKAAVPLAELLRCAPAEIPVYEISQNPVTVNGVTLTPDWRSDGAEQVHSATRSRLCLNGLWAIQPDSVSAPDSATNSSVPQAADWAFFKVPGFLRPDSPPFLIYGQDKTTWASLDVTRRARVLWYVRNVEIPPAAASDGGAKIFLTISGMRGFSVVVYWNGKRAGTLTDQLGGRMDLTSVLSQIRSDAKNAGSPRAITGQLALRALATIKETENAWLMEGGAMVRQYDMKDFAREPARGFSDIFLETGPPAPAFAQDTIQVVPSYREKNLTVLFSSPATVTSVPATQTWSVIVRDQEGNTVLQQRDLRPRLHAQTGKNQIIVPWQNPRLWTPDDPRLYTLTLAADTAASDGNLRAVDESLPIRFGFREIWVDGKNLILNGHVLRLRPRLLYTPLLDGDSLRRQFSFLKDMGFNCTLRPGVGDVHEQERNTQQSIENYYNIADEMGIMVIPFSVHSLITVRKEFGEAGMSEADQQHLFDYIARHMTQPLANHPSVIGWSGFGSGANYSEGMNSVATRPDVWGITPLDQDGVLERTMTDPGSRTEARKRLAAARHFVHRLKALDPTRPYIAHFDGGSGDAWGIWSYFNWTPLQEWEQWPATWSQEGTRPVGATEHGFPYVSSFLNHGLPDGNSEPWITEYAAIDLGPEIYTNDPSGYLRKLRTEYNPVSGGYAAKTGAHHKFASDMIAANDAKVQAVWAHRNRSIYRAWRTYGVPLGIEPFGRSDQFYRGSQTNRDNGKVIANPTADLRTAGYQNDCWYRSDYWPSETMPWLSTTPTGKKPEGLTPLGEVLYEVNRPLLVYIAGAPGRPVTKDHVFWAGEKIAKQIAAVWDGYSARDLSIVWKATLGNNTSPRHTLAGGTLSLTLNAGDIRLLPIEWQAPAVDRRSEGRVEIEVSDAKTRTLVATDSFSFQVYPRPAPLSGNLRQARIVVFDLSEQSETHAALRKLGLAPVVLTSLAAWKGGDLLVIGKGALPALAGQSAALAALPPQVPVLVMEQTSAALEALGFRTYPIRHRTVFPVTPGHPVLRDIEPADLKDWRVTPTLLPSGVDPLRNGYLYHSTYEGTLVSVSIETPTRGNFTPFLQCGFDLRETPLLETRHKQQRWLYSQLSLTDAVNATAPAPSAAQGDPVATRLLTNLLEYVLQPVVSANNPRPEAFALFGDDTDLSLIRDLGANATEIHRLASPASVTATGPAAHRLAIVGNLDAATITTATAANVDSDAVRVLKAWVSDGGTAVLLPQKNLRIYQDLFPAKVAAVRELTLGQAPVPGNGTGIFEGIGQGNFHYRQPLPILVFKTGSNVIDIPEGAGRWVLIGFNPRNLDVKKQPYLRLTYRNQNRALAQILTNLGFPLSQPVETVFRRASQSPFVIDVTRDGIARIKANQANASTGSPARGASGDVWLPFGLATQTTSYGDALLEIRFTAPPSLSDEELMADLGTMDDYDETTLNGTPIGSTTPSNTKPDEAWKTKRLYKIPPGLLRSGENTLTLRVWNRNAAAKGWKTIVRGPMQIRTMQETVSPYLGSYLVSDDVYLQRMW